MARTTPAQKPRGEHSSTFSGGFCPAPDTVMAASFVAPTTDMDGPPAPVKRGWSRADGMKFDRTVRDGEILCAASLPRKPRVIAGVELIGVGRPVMVNDRRQRAAGADQARSHVAIGLRIDREVGSLEQLVEGLRRLD